MGIMNVMKRKKTIRSIEDIPLDPERPDTLLVFHSKQGSTLQYAKWLVEELDCDVMPYTRRRLGYTILYRNIIFLSWLRASELTRLKLLRRNALSFLLPAKKVILAAVGVSEPTPHYLERLGQFNMEPEFTYPSLHFLPGRHIPSKGRFIKWMYGRHLYDGLLPEEAAVLRHRLENGWDGVDRTRLAPIVQEILQTRSVRPALKA